MDHEGYSAYPSEAEVLLTDGCDMFVLSVDKDVKIQNNTDGLMAKYSGKNMTIVHMFHTGSYKEKQVTE